MKKVLYFAVLYLLCFNLAELQAQTYANVPGPENVLVVYKLPDPITRQIQYQKL
ncbi:MAG: hypothetical protein K6T54_06105 [Ignavibacterium sp.]|nr:hypothetical protein [Ignavibacterium sp.]